MHVEGHRRAPEANRGSLGSLGSQYPQKEFLLRVSYMEIYNETVTDLLVDSWKRKPLEVREALNVRAAPPSGILPLPLSSPHPLILLSPSHLISLLSPSHLTVTLSSHHPLILLSPSHLTVTLSSYCHPLISLSPSHLTVTLSSHHPLI